MGQRGNVWPEPSPETPQVPHNVPMTLWVVDDDNEVTGGVNPHVRVVTK